MVVSKSPGGSLWGSMKKGMSTPTPLSAPRTIRLSAAYKQWDNVHSVCHNAGGVAERTATGPRRPRTTRTEARGTTSFWHRWRGKGDVAPDARFNYRFAEPAP